MKLIVHSALATLTTFAIVLSGAMAGCSDNAGSSADTPAKDDTSHGGADAGTEPKGDKCPGALPTHGDGCTAKAADGGTFTCSYGGGNCPSIASCIDGKWDVGGLPCIGDGLPSECPGALPTHGDGCTFTGADGGPLTCSYGDGNCPSIASCIDGKWDVGGLPCADDGGPPAECPGAVPTQGDACTGKAADGGTFTCSYGDGKCPSIASCIDGKWDVGGLPCANE